MLLRNGERLFRWPLELHVINHGWHYANGGFHGAVDLKTDAVGTPVYAAEDGTIEQVQYWDGGTRTGMQSYGNMVQLRHADYNGRPLQSRYAHLSVISVRAGQTVREGQLLGYSGNTGNSSGPHLHFEVRWNGQRVHPLNWLDDDFICKSDAARRLLGDYKSVAVPEEPEAETAAGLPGAISGPAEAGRYIITIGPLPLPDYEAVCRRLRKTARKRGLYPYITVEEA